MTDREDKWNECYECRMLGDDYSLDKGGELVSNCDDCPLNPASLEELRYESMDWFEDESEEDEDD